MSEKQIRALLQDIAEQKAPSTEIDLWWNIQERLKQTPLQTGNRTQPRGFTMSTPKQQNRLSYAALAFVAFILAGGIFFATPRGRALAQEILQFFTRASSDTLRAPTQAPLNWVEQTPGVPAPTKTSIAEASSDADCGSYQHATCTTEQIRSKVNFTVKELDAIPDGMVFIGATNGLQGVFILYDTPDHSGGIALFENPWKGEENQTGWEIGASATVEKIDISGSAGEYVIGSFGYRDGETQVTWDANANVQTLRWVDQGVSIIMQNYGIQLSKEEFVALANNLTIKAVSGPVTPAPVDTEIPAEAFDIRSIYPLSLDETQNFAGFKLPQPSSLPDILSFIGASFNPVFGNVSLFYQRNQEMGSNTDGLLLTVEPISPSENNNICGLTLGDKEDLAAQNSAEPDHVCKIKIVGDLENVKIGEISGQYSQGVWSGTDQGWEWDATPYLKNLRWQKDGFAFELSYMGMDISKEDLITIALSIK